MKDWRCGCGKEFTSKDLAIAHSKKEHGNDPESCYDELGTTWDPVLTRLCGKVVSSRSEARKATEALEEEKKKLDILMAKFQTMHSRWWVLQNLFVTWKD